MSDEVTYEITFTDRGPIRVTIPTTWKVTFGALVPAKAGASSGPHGLRIWEGTDKQRAVFANVASFRDLALDVKVAAVRKYGTTDWYRDDGESWRGPNADLVEKAWMLESEISTTKPPWQDEMFENTVPWEQPRAVKYR